MNTEELTVEPLVSYETLAFVMEAFLLGIAIFVVGIYVLPPLSRWFKSLFVLDSDRIELPQTWNFETEPISHVKVIGTCEDLVPTVRKPYDWAEEEDDDFTN